MPRGFASPAVSGIFGMPVELEKRTVIAVELLLKCGAELSVPASDVGVNVPLSRMPLAWAARGSVCHARLKEKKKKNRPGRKPGGVEKAPLRVCTRLFAVSLVFSLVDRGILNGSGGAEVSWITV